MAARTINVMEQYTQEQKYEIIFTNRNAKAPCSITVSQDEKVATTMQWRFRDRFAFLARASNIWTFDKGRNKTFNLNRFKPQSDRQISFVAFKDNYWTAFTISFLISFADSLDFYTMVYSMHKIASFYKTSKANMSQAITYSILQRTLGGLFSVSFGASFGQKYMIVLDMIMLGSLQVAATFCKNVNLFLIVRALFGLGMSSLFSFASLNLIKNSPQSKRTFIGAMFQCSTPLAAILAAGLNIIFHQQDDSWKKMFWTSASVSYFCAIVRFIIPERKTLQAQEIIPETEHASRQDWRARMRTARENTINKPWNQIKIMLKMHWRIFMYSTILMCISTWYSHAINDTYVTFLIFGKHNRNRAANRILMIIKSTSVPGIIMSGALAQLFGIRRIVIPMAIIAMALIPAALLPYSRWGLALGGAFLNFFTEAFLALFPAYIVKNAPSQFSIILPAMAYPLGACISSPSSQIVNVLGEKLFFTRKGQKIPAYQFVILTTALITIFFTIFWFYLGPKDDDEVEELTPVSEQTPPNNTQSIATVATEHLETPETAIHTSSYLINHS